MLLNRRQLLLVLSSIPFIKVTFVDAQSKYLHTISGLQWAYGNEIQAYMNYNAYAEKAKSEKYPNIAYLFVSFAASEFIHARNFKQILSELGLHEWEPPKPEVRVLSTKENLKNALDFEIEDIDRRYPEVYEKIKPERHDGAIRSVIYAWESEKQHRDLIMKMQSGTGIFFGVLAKRIEAMDLKYFVCQTCGSTVVGLKKDTCAICKGPISNYKEVERLK